MKTTAKIILDSISHDGARLTTMQLTYPRFIHSEFMTHRVFSRNAASSRAIPVAKMIDQVRDHPAMPIHWGKNQPGMQAREEVTDIPSSIHHWRLAAMDAANHAERMNNIGLHKQVVNRILEPFQWMHTIVTATDWDNFFKLRLHPDADPNIYELARVMKEAMDGSVPDVRTAHFPYCDEFSNVVCPIDIVAYVSAARCARVSYLNHDGTAPDKEKDIALAEMLIDAGHASPFEHAAFRLPCAADRCANFAGWESYRSEIGI